MYGGISFAADVGEQKIEGRLWPRVVAQVAEIRATLPTFQGIPERPVWSGQFRKSTVACGSEVAMALLLVQRPIHPINVKTIAHSNAALLRPTFNEF
jgi:hypothetical protein